MALSSIQENASRLGMRIQESLSEHTRDLALVGRSANASYFDSAEDKIKQISTQLTSNSDRDKLDAMKRLIALVSKGRNVSEFFAQVVLNVASPNLEIRKLVYIYLIRHAASEPDLTLLSINTFQKDLADPNPLIRAMALRVLSAIGVPMTGNVVAMGIKKCATDPSPYVRKAAALAIPKCYAWVLDASLHGTLLSTLNLLLKNHTSLSVGAVARAFSIICPHKLELLHPHYRKLCKVLVDADEWGQVELLDLLGRYARTMLSRPVEGLRGLAGKSSESKNDVEKFLEDTPGTSFEALDPDLLLLLKCSENLLHSRNPAVVLSVTRIHWYLAPSSYRSKILSPLLRLLHLSTEIERVVVENLGVIAQEQPSLLKPYLTRFFVRASDSPPAKISKLRILLALVDASNVGSIINECKDYAYDEDERFGRAAADAIGRCARAVPDASGQCVAALLSLSDSGDDTAATASVLSLRALLQTQSNTSIIEIVQTLARQVEDIKHPEARACVVWLVGQYAGLVNETASRSPFAIEGIAEWAPDVLRIMARRFTTELDAPKLATLTLAAKLITLNPHAPILQKLVSYVLALARWDTSYDVRDRARWIGGLIRGFLKLEENQGKREKKMGPKANPGCRGSTPLEGTRSDTSLHPIVILAQRRGWIDSTRVLGSLSLVTGMRDFTGTGTGRPFPDWCEEPTDGELRDTEDDNKPAPPPAPTFLSSRNIGSHGVPTPRSGGAPRCTHPTNNSGPMARRAKVKRRVKRRVKRKSEEGSEEEGSEEEGSEEEGGEDNEDEDAEDGDEDEEEEEGESDQDKSKGHENRVSRRRSPAKGRNCSRFFACH
ncbi:non-SMC mitotic condensation complex subunit 1 [Rhizoctonia solani]|uniref:Non-SMC mitotic condensation complex subunit 1 n=1 Tax=Rhizoctonia solani TaxID=456999 RepID=A0A8H7M3U9_9AGAM|nr:non-SMC mitotic condensation complex subunit 1 [Rhizoctonia solani]